MQDSAVNRPTHPITAPPVGEQPGHFPQVHITHPTREFQHDGVDDPSDVEGFILKVDGVAGKTEAMEPLAKFN